MNSVIHATDRITNVKHEFGESMESRYWVTFVSEDGVEHLIALTQVQIDIATARADRERDDAWVYRRMLEERERSEVRGFIVIWLATLAAFGALAWLLLR